MSTSPSWRRSRLQKTAAIGGVAAKYGEIMKISALGMSSHGVSAKAEISRRILRRESGYSAHRRKCGGEKPALGILAQRIGNQLGVMRR